MRRSRLWIALAAALVVVIGAFLLALPAIVRHVALAQLRAATGREVTVARARLNPFTRTLRLEDVRERVGALGVRLQGHPRDAIGARDQRTIARGTGSGGGQVASGARDERSALATRGL